MASTAAVDSTVLPAARLLQHGAARRDVLQFGPSRREHDTSPSRPSLLQRGGRLAAGGSTRLAAAAVSTAGATRLGRHHSPRRSPVLDASGARTPPPAPAPTLMAGIYQHRHSPMLQIYISSVSDVSRYVAVVSYECYKNRSGMLHML
jgi:hypothetical protein